MAHNKGVESAPADTVSNTWLLEHKVIAVPKARHYIWIAIADRLHIGFGCPDRSSADDYLSATAYDESPSQLL